MHRWSVRLGLAAVAFTLATSTATAQGLTAGEGALRKQGVLTVGPLIGINFPVGDLGDVASTGFTFAGQVTYGITAVTLLGEAGYTSFSGRNNLSSVGSFSFGAGARIPIPLLGFYAGGVAEYYTGDLEEFDILPLVGIHFGPFDLGVRYKGLFGDADWIGLTGAVHFRLK